MRFRVFFVLGFLASASVALAAIFPKTAPEEAFADQKIYDVQGRPWRAAREDWDGAKKRIATDPTWASWLKRERAAVDAWMVKHRDRVEWVAGWSHDGVSPVDASRLTWTEKIPSEEVSFLTSPSDPHVEITPKIMAWWVVTFRGRHVDTMVRAARLYRLTGDEHYAAWAAGQMEFYADNYLKWEPQREGARLFWQTLTEASNLVKFTEAVRLLGSYATTEHRQQWRAKFFQPEVAVLNANFQAIHNIATWQRCAVAQVALLFGDEAMWHEAIDGKYGLRRQMADGVTSDYLWREQSLGYNNFVVNAVLTLFTTASLYGRAEELAHEMAIAEDLMLSLATLRFPDGHLPNPADSGAPGTAPNSDLYGTASRVFPTPLGLEVAAKRRDWTTLLDPPQAPPRASTLPTVVSRSLETTRMALLKSGPWQVFLHYGQLTRSHTESEALNYSAYFNDTDVTHDPGTVGYGSPLHRGYYTRGANHNVPLVAGEGEDLGPFGERREWVVDDSDVESPLRGELLAFTVSPARVSAAQPSYRTGVRASRTLEIKGDALIDTATIASTAGEPQRLALALHLQGKVRLPETFLPAPDFAAGRPEPFAQWRGVRGATFQDRADFDVAYGKVVLHVTLTAPGEFTLWHGDTPDFPPQRRESLYLELAQPAASATFTTVFAPASNP
jgi:oligo-alginate lyase